MNAVIETEAVPIQIGADGVWRIGSSRVTFDTVAAAFDEGATAEEITQQYPSLALAEVYAALGWYLKHRPEAETYLRTRDAERQRVRQANEARFGPVGIRSRLLARQAAKA